MATIRVSEWLPRTAAVLQQQAAEDLFYSWLEELYALLREQAWSWNTTYSRGLLYEATAEPDTTLFTWSEGSRVVSASDPLTLGYTTTGRMVQLGDEWYRITDYKRTNASQFIVDREILGDEADGIALTFYRHNLSLRTSRIYSVFINGKKADRQDRSADRQRFGYYPQVRSTGTPYAYLDGRNRVLEPPAYELTVAPSGTAGFDDGTYLYFATRYDPESGLESAPGITTTYTSAAANKPNVTYANPSSSNTLEGDSHYLRIYRSQKFTGTTPVRDRVAMYLMVQQEPTGASVFLDSNRGRLANLERYYDGPRSEIEWAPYPDVRFSYDVEHLNSWGRRPIETDYLEIGDNLEAEETFRQYVLALSHGALKGDATVFRTQMASVRAQIAYLIGKSRAAGESDVTPGRTHQPYLMGDDNSPEAWFRLPDDY